MRTYAKPPRTSPSGPSLRRKAGKKAGVRRQPLDGLHELHRTIGNQAVQRTITLADYNGHTNVEFKKPTAGSTKALLKEKAIDDIGYGVVKAVKALVSDPLNHSFADVAELAKHLDKQLNKKKSGSAIDKVAKSEHKKNSKLAKLVLDPTAKEVLNGRALTNISKGTLAALREHQQKKANYASLFGDFKTNIKQPDGVDSGGDGNALKDMMMYMDYIESEGVQDLHGKIQDVAFSTNLDTSTKNPEEALSMTHVSMSGTKKKSAYATFPANNIQLPLLSDNKSQQTLNALEASRNSGAFIFSQIGKYKSLQNNWMTPQNAIDPMQHGSFEISSISGQHRNDFNDRLAENSNRTYDMLLANNDGWAKQLEGHVKGYQDSKASDDDKFKAFKEGSRLMVQQLGAFTNQDKLTPPSTPEYQTVYDNM
ncbi:hypothetical protein B5M42_009750 [Paenibacillus athensensis]|uniref:Uncharacterized protein n=1 Tax=Paenibacillus athensensis TaxID=1967502 RepID=A0A4Y8Q9N9_9BACL|nr:hypothetical protein [Paenibacillus athensensis]MCD1259121.1 hypothetical protein [Paenibacillus athensensis]